MKKFIAVFMGSESSPAFSAWKALDEKTRQQRDAEGKAQWMQWVGRHQGSVIDVGAPLGKTKQINIDGISDIKNQITAYTIVQAPSHEDAAKLFLNHPHFSIFPGESIEIMECLPIPT